MILPGGPMASYIGSTLASPTASSVIPGILGSLVSRSLPILGITAGLAAIPKIVDYMGGTDIPSFEEVYREAQGSEETPLDMDEAYKAYRTLVKFAPDIAEDPLAASTFIRRAARYGNISLEEIMKLIDSQKQRAHGKSFDKGFLHSIGEALKAAI